MNLASGRTRSRSLAIGDVDNDGDIDVIFGQQPSSDHGGFNTLHRNTGSGRTGFGIEATIQEASAFDTFAVELADLNGDGYLDLIEGNQGAPTHIYFNQGAGNPGSFNPPVRS